THLPWSSMAMRDTPVMLPPGRARLVTMPDLRGSPVTATMLITEMLGLTLALALFSFVLTWVLAIPAGIYSATHPRSVGDPILTVINYIGVATPNFMLALFLMWVAFAYFDVSVTGLFSPDYVNAPWSWGRVADLLEHIWLPALVLGIAGTARLSRIMRANLLDELNKPYVVTARAKGMKEWRLV